MKTSIEIKREYTLVLTEREKETLCCLLQNPRQDWPIEMKTLSKEIFQALNPPIAE
jgi:hypothetical protein